MFTIWFTTRLFFYFVCLLFTDAFTFLHFWIAICSLCSLIQFYVLLFLPFITMDWPDFIDSLGIHVLPFVVYFYSFLRCTVILPPFPTTTKPPFYSTTWCFIRFPNSEFATTIFTIHSLISDDIPFWSFYVHFYCNLGTFLQYLLSYIRWNSFYLVWLLPFLRTFPTVMIRWPRSRCLFYDTFYRFHSVLPDFYGLPFHWPFLFLPLILPFYHHFCSICSVLSPVDTFHFPFLHRVYDSVRSFFRVWTFVHHYSDFTDVPIWVYICCHDDLHSIPTSLLPVVRFYDGWCYAFALHWFLFTFHSCLLPVLYDIHFYVEKNSRFEADSYILHYTYHRTYIHYIPFSWRWNLEHSLHSHSDSVDFVLIHWLPPTYHIPFHSFLLHSIYRFVRFRRPISIPFYVVLIYVHSLPCHCDLMTPDHYILVYWSTVTILQYLMMRRLHFHSTGDLPVHWNAICIDHFWWYHSSTTITWEDRQFLIHSTIHCCSTIHYHWVLPPRHLYHFILFTLISF